MECLLEIGGRRMIIAGAPWTEATVPANFRPFVRPLENGTEQAVALSIEYGAMPALPASRPLSESFNDLGRAALHDGGDSWIVVLTPRPGEQPRVMEMARDFRSATLRLLTGDPYAGFVIDSMTRIYFSQYVALHGDMITHASVVGCDGRAYMFMGRSGTGKSTHSRMWMEAFGCTLINDDCPMIHKDCNGDYLACGTPWSGKTPCWRDMALPLAGIARLRQAPANSFHRLSDVEAFVAFIPGMSVMTADSALYSAASSAALDIIARIPVGMLDCLPDRDAARVCRNAFAACTAI